MDDGEPSPTLPWFLGQVLRAMRCKANGWTLHSRLKMEELEQLAAPLLAIRENKAVQMEIDMKRNESSSCVLHQQRHAGVCGVLFIEPVAFK